MPAAADDALPDPVGGDSAASGDATGPVNRLTPVQIRTLESLRRTGDPIVFDPELIASLRAEMGDALSHFASRLDDRTDLFINKHKIGSALDCEELHLTPDEFEWTPANAQGTIAHKAIELLISWRDEPLPADLVDEAMRRLADDRRGPGEWIETLSPGDHAEVHSRAAERVTRFIEDFPPLSRRWAPLTEASVRWPNSGRIVLSGKVDLMFGPRPGLDDDPRESRKVIVDLKTGRPSPRHRQDLAFYALLETLIREVPPRKVATFYLDAGVAEAEDVSDRLLHSAVRRTLDGIHAIIGLEFEGREPIRRPGSACRWCPVSSDCDDGQAHLATLT